MSKTTLIRVSTNTHKEIKVLAAKEQIQMMELVDEMVDLYKYNRQSGDLAKFRAMVEKCKEKNNL